MTGQCNLLKRGESVLPAVRCSSWGGTGGLQRDAESKKGASERAASGQEEEGR